MKSTTLTKNKNEINFTNNFYDENEPAPIFDKYGNPTPETLQAFYEVEHGLTEETTLEDLQAWIDSL